MFPRGLASLGKTTSSISVLEWSTVFPLDRFIPRSLCPPNPGGAANYPDDDTTNVSRFSVPSLDGWEKTLASRKQIPRYPSCMPSLQTLITKRVAPSGRLYYSTQWFNATYSLSLRALRGIRDP